MKRLGVKQQQRRVASGEHDNFSKQLLARDWPTVVTLAGYCMMSEPRNLGCLPSVANGGWQATYLFLFWYLSLNGSTMT